MIGITAKNDMWTGVETIWECDSVMAAADQEFKPPETGIGGVVIGQED